MSRIVVKCDKCGEIGACESNSDLIHRVNNCNGHFIETSLSYDDFWLLCDISDDNDFLQAMIDLKEKDPIEYQLKMSQFKTQVQQQESNTPKCPTCNSTNLKKISGLSKAGSVAVWGLLSQKVKKTYHCNSCGYEW